MVGTINIKCGIEPRNYKCIGLSQTGVGFNKYTYLSRLYRCIYLALITAEFFAGCRAGPSLSPTCDLH